MPIALAVTVAVLTYGPPSLAPRTEAVGRAVRAAALARGMAVVDGPLVARAEEELARGWIGEAQLAPLGRAREAIADGRRALERVELERAEAALGRAEAALDDEALLGWPGAATVRAEAARLRGVALYELGRAAAAGEAWRRAAALEPAAAVTEAEVRPDVVRAWRAAIARGASTAAAAATARLEVRWDGCALPAVLELDGREVPHEGCAVDVPVAPGVHFARVRGAGRPAARLVEVVAGEAAPTVTLRRGLDDWEALSAGHERPARAALAAAARAIGLDGAIVVGFGVDRGDAVVYGARVTAAGCATDVVREAASDEARAAELLVGRLASADERCGEAARALDDGRAIVEAPGVARPTERPAVPPSTPTKPPPQTTTARGKRIWERPWLWLGIVGVSAAAIGLGAGLGTRGATTTATLDARGFAQ